MKLNVHLVLSFCLIFVFKGNAQVPPDPFSSPVIQPLAVGQQVPDNILLNVLDGRSLRLDDFHGKLLILDFWATSCGACIQNMPRLDSLQKKYADRIVILPVTAENGTRVARFRQANRYLAGLEFRTVIEDRQLHALFPHRLLPHEVWISCTGNVLGFTEIEAVNARNIESALAGKPLNVSFKIDVLNYDNTRPLFVGNNGGADTIYRYRSIMSGQLPGLQSSVSIICDSVKQRTIVRATNVNARRLYTIIYKQLRTLRSDQVQIANDTGLFCYELDLPSSSPARVRQSIREDLDRFFNVRSEYTVSSFRLVPLQNSRERQEPLTL